MVAGYRPLLALGAGEVRLAVGAGYRSNELLNRNLLSNALKFVPEGRAPQVRVFAEVHDGVATIRVTDNGIGIAPEHVSRLFQPFQRLNLKSEYEGTGLGLAVARQVAEAHGGTIAVRPNAGQGAVFEVLLPLPPA